MPLGGSAAGGDDGLLAVGDADLGEDSGEVGLHGLGPHEEFLGDLGVGEAVGDELRDADLMVLPSRGEGLPLAIVEAMAHGLPVIATRVGGNEEAVDDGNTGLLVPPEQPEALAAAMIQLARDHEARRRMGDAARRAWASGGWSPDAVVADALQLYASAATGPRAR